MLRTLSLSSAKEAVEAVEALYEEIAEAHAETTFVETGDFTDPYEFADAVVNNLPAIQYALNAGLPVTAWGPLTKNPGEVDRVLKAVRQWNEQAAALIERLAGGYITQDQFYEGLVAAYNQQAQNAFTAGKRALGNLAPLNAPQNAKLAALTTPDTNALTQMQTDAGSAPLAAGGGAGGGLGKMVSGMISPQNFIGSGLPGDPMALLMGGGKAEKGAAGAFANRIEQYGKSIGSYASAGEMAALDDVEEAMVVWWELGEADHCVDCLQMADLSPFTLGTLDDAGIFPGSGHTQCGSNCACDLTYDAPTEVCGDSLAGRRTSASPIQLAQK